MLLELKNVETYYGPIMAIRGVSLAVPEGRIVAVLGANGAGKTTILRTISGVMDPQKGEILFAGEDIARRDPDAVMRLGLSHVPEGREVFPFLSVNENLRMGAFSRRDRAGIAGDLDRVYDYFPALADRGSQPASQLSGGEQQMLAIGRALMAHPKMLLLDEPSLGLSPILVHQIFEIIRRINEEAGMTILVVEQKRPRRAAALALRLRARERKGGHGRHLREARELAGHPGVLPRHEGPDAEGGPPVEEAQDLEVSMGGPESNPDLVRETRTADDGRELELWRDTSFAGTVPTMFWSRVERYGDRIAMREKDFGIWQDVSWRTFGEKARHTGLALRSLGFGKGDVACILSNTIVEWMFADMGVLGVGGVCAGIYPTDAAEQVDYLVNDSGCKVMFVEDEEQLDKVLEVREKCPTLEQIVIFDMEGLRDFEDPRAMSYDDLLALGREQDELHPGAWAGCLELAKPEDLAILVYTSGTTGPPKGAMISHHNLVFQCVNAPHVLSQGEDDERMAFLPLCHIAERIFVYGSLYTGTKLNFVENPETVPENAQEIQPTLFFSVPRVWEKFYSAISIALSDATFLQRWAYGKAIGIGFKRADRRLAGKKPGGAPGARLPSRRCARAAQHSQVSGPRPLSLDRHRGGADLTRSDPLVSRTRHRHGGGLRPDREHRHRLHASAGRQQARHRRPLRALRRDQDLRGGRDPDPRRVRLHGLPQPAGEDGRDDSRRLAPHRRRRRDRRRGLPQDHRPHEGHHHHGRRQEHHAERDREPVEVLAPTSPTRW